MNIPSISASMYCLVSADAKRYLGLVGGKRGHSNNTAPETSSNPIAVVTENRLFKAKTYSSQLAYLQKNETQQLIHLINENYVPKAREEAYDSFTDVAAQLDISAGEYYLDYVREMLAGMSKSKRMQQERVNYQFNEAIDNIEIDTTSGLKGFILDEDQVEITNIWMMVALSTPIQE